MVVFSMDSPETFEEAIRLREAIIETKKSAIQGSTKNKNKIINTLKVPMVIAGNKCERDIKYVLYIYLLTFYNIFYNEMNRSEPEKDYFNAY